MAVEVGAFLWLDGKMKEGGEVVKGTIEFLTHFLNTHV